MARGTVARSSGHGRLVSPLNTGPPHGGNRLRHAIVVPFLPKNVDTLHRACATGRQWSCKATLCCETIPPLSSD